MEVWEAKADVGADGNATGFENPNGTHGTHRGEEGERDQMEPRRRQADSSHRVEYLGLKAQAKLKRAVGTAALLIKPALNHI